jgi:hypothetical protein
MLDSLDRVRKSEQEMAPLLKRARRCFEESPDGAKCLEICASAVRPVNSGEAALIVEGGTVTTHDTVASLAYWDINNLATPLVQSATADAPGVKMETNADVFAHVNGIVSEQVFVSRSHLVISAVNTLLKLKKRKRACDGDV